VRIQDDFNSGLHADAINEQRSSLMVDHNGAGGTERAGKGSLEEWSMQEVIKRFARDESSATAIEYGLIAAGISVCDYRHCSTCGNKPRSRQSQTHSNKWIQTVSSQSPGYYPGLFLLGYSSTAQGGGKRRSAIRRKGGRWVRREAYFWGTVTTPRRDLSLFRREHQKRLSRPALGMSPC
jgi:hypothetical protein